MPDLESALAVIRRAIASEIAGQRFYSEAAFHCIDPWAKEVFADLVTEEEAHTRLLLLEYEALTTQGRWIDPEVAMASSSEVDITKFTFPDQEPTEELFPPQWSATEAIDRRADDLAALAFGVRLERKAIDLYTQAARETDDPVAIEAYNFLVEEETRHYDQLRAQWQSLQSQTLAGVPLEEEEKDA
jgi:rubrerythrin